MNILVSYITNLIPKLIVLPFLILSLCVHEFAHGYVAYKLGDNTAKNMGRLTLNPLAHLDVVGTISMIFFSFGWAKSVPVNPYYFKNPKRGMAITALAGPVSNFLMAFIGTVAYVLYWRFTKTYSSQIIYAFLYFIQVNLVLMAFNLIPFPPLDGSKFVYAILSDKAYFKLMQYERYGMVAIIFLSYFGFFSNYLSNAVTSVSVGMINFVIKIFSLIGV